MIEKKLTEIRSNKLLKETIWSFLAKGTASVFFIGLNIILARYLGPDKFGIWSFFFSILTIFFLFSYFGINASSRKYIAQYNETEYLGSVLRASFKLRVVFSLGVTLLFLFIHKPLVLLLGRPDLETLFLAATPLIFLSGLTEYFKDVFQGLHRLKYNFYITVAEYGLKFVITLSLFLLLESMLSIVYSFILALVVTSVIGAYFFYADYYKKNDPVEKKFDKDIFKYSLPLFFISIGFVVATEVDTVMIGILSSSKEVGIYSVAKQIIVKLPHIAFAIALGGMPVFAKLNDGNREELKELFYKLLKSNSIIFGSIGTLILTTSWFIIPMAFGLEYSASVGPLMILVLYLIFYSYSIFLSLFLNYQGKASKQAVNLAISLAINIILNILLIPQYGANGAAIATSVSYAPYTVLNWLEVRKILIYSYNSSWKEVDPEPG